MVTAKTWRTGIVWVAMAWGCSDHRAPPVAQTPPPAERSQTQAAVSPAPPRDAGSETVPDAGSDSPPDAGSREAAGLPGSVLSPSGRLALVWPVKDQFNTIEVYTLPSHTKPTRVAVAKEAVARPTSARVRWTAGDRILLSWSAGTNAAQGKLYTPEGKILLEVAGSGMSLSPSLKYLATYPTLLADEPVIEVYDMTTGRKVAEKTASAETFWEAQGVEWRPQQFLAHFIDNSDRPVDVRIDLEASP